MNHQQHLHFQLKALDRHNIESEQPDTSSHRLYIMKDGELKVHIHDKVLILKSGEVLPICSGEEIQLIPDGPFALFLFKFSDEFLLQGTASIPWFDFCFQYERTRRTALPHLEAFIQTTAFYLNQSTKEQQDTLSYSALKTLVLFLMSASGQKPVLECKESSLFLEFKKLADHRIHQMFLVKHYTQTLNTSVRELSNQVKRHTSCTVKNYLDKIRTRKISSLLCRKSLSVKEVAFYMNFDEPTNMAKFFKRNYGCSPKEFRQNLLTRQSEGIKISGF